MVIVNQYHDGGIIDLQEKELFNFLEKAGLLTDSVNGRVSFCGVICIGETVSVFLPKTFSQSVNKIENAKLMVSCIRKYATNRGTLLTTDIDPSSRIRGISPVVAMEILEDYIRSGLYRNSDPEIKARASGKISWPHVVKKLLPHLRDDGTPVYSDLLVRRINYFSSNDVTAIHAAIVSKLDLLYSWCLDRYGESIAPELTDRKLPFEESKCISLLKRELSSVFADRDIRLLKNLIYVLEAQAIAPEDSNIVTGIYDFAHVWEDICSELYGNQVSKLADKLPVPAYVVHGKPLERQRNTQLMDIVLEEEFQVAVLDAKYYIFSKAPPAWPDLVKQFFYAKTLSYIFPEKSVLNFFIAPRPEHQGPEKVLVVDSENESLSEIFGEIGIVYLNIALAIQDYVDNCPIEKYRASIFKNALAKAA